MKKMNKAVYILLSLIVSLSASAALVNRYDFTTDASDSVGSADGTLEDGATVSDGQLVLNGAGAYVNLDPNSPGNGILINQYTTGLTLEMWLTQPADLNQNWSMSAALGNTVGGQGDNFIGISTTRGENLSRAIIHTTVGGITRDRSVTGPEYEDGIEHHFVAVVDDPDEDGSGTFSYYIDGQLQGTVSLNGIKVADLSTELAYLGKGLWTADGTVTGLMNEFRIHDRGLPLTGVLLSTQLGPDNTQQAALESMTPQHEEDAYIYDPVTSLSWVPSAGLSVDHYEVFLSDDPNVIDPNEAMTTALVGSTVFTNLDVSGLTASTEYAWRVDVIESGTMNRLLGPAYTFTTSVPGPVILADPENTDVKLAGETGELTVECHSSEGAAVTMQWFKVGDPDVEITEADSDVTITNSTVGYVTTSTLSIANLDADDEGYYYATATDSKGSASSDTALIFVRVGLTHRYSFNDTADDSEGGAHGTVIDPAGRVSYTNDTHGGRQITIDTTNTGSNSGTISYVDLPNGIISALGSQATFEVWFTWAGPSNENWQRVFDFGVSDGGEDASSGAGGSNYFMLTPRAGVTGNPMRFGYTNNVAGLGERVLDRTLQAPVGTEVFVAVTWNEDTGEVKLYVNGQWISTNDLHVTFADINDVNNWLGRAQWGDAGYKGSITEFRIYDEALSPGWIEAHYNSGPDVIPANACVNPPLMDANDDCRVNLEDLGVLASEWLACGLVVCD
jgi:hypothetical protein